MAGFALNAVLAAQMVYYWNSGSAVKSKAQKKPRAVPAASSPKTPKGQKGEASGAKVKGASASTRRRG